MTTLTELIDRWGSDIGKPYKGDLIDWDDYNGGNTGPGCMCAQGQVLHDLGGWTPERLRDAGQREADIATAKLLNISLAHAILLRKINDNADGAPAVVLTDPGKVLGDQWSKLLDFWWHLDGMTMGQWEAARDAAWGAAGGAARKAARAAARAAAGTAARDAAWDAAWTAAWDAAWTAAGKAARAAARAAAWNVAGNVAAWASNEIQGAAIMRKANRPFFFLPFFGFASPEDIPARPADYGQVKD